MLPKMKEMRHGFPSSPLPYGDSETKRKAIERGAEGLLTKPIDFTLLRQEIDNRLQPGPASYWSMLVADFVAIVVSDP